MRVLVCICFLASVALASDEQLHPSRTELHPDGSMTKVSAIHTRLVGETICDAHTRASAGCCASAEEHKTKCCQNVMVCSRSHAADDLCDEQRRLSTCCTSPYSKCCRNDCFREPELRGENTIEPEIKERPEDQCNGISRDRNQCCPPGEHLCCKRCPLPFVFSEVDSTSSVVAPPSSPAELAEAVAPQLSPAPRFAEAAYPPAANPRAGVMAPSAAACAPAGCPPAKNMVKAKVDCSDERRQMTCCKGKNDHLWTCCQKLGTCPSEIGTMKMGQLCDDLKKATTCCTTPANKGCCRQCSSTVVMPLATGCATPVTACCTSTVTNCCRTC